MEIVRQKGVATYIVFPIIDISGDLVSGATGLDSEITDWSDSATPIGFVDCTSEAVEIGSSGQYFLSLTAAEMSKDYIVVQVKTTTADAKTQTIIIRTTNDFGAFGILRTTIAALTSQEEFTLTNGSSDNDAYNNFVALVRDQSDPMQVAPCVIEDYVGGTKTVHLLSDPGIFAMAPGDEIIIIAMMPEVVRKEMDDNSVMLAALSATPTPEEIADYVFAQIIEAGISFEDLMRVLLSVLAGLTTGSATGTIAFRDFNNTKDRLSFTVDLQGNRTARITFDAS